MWPCLFLAYLLKWTCMFVTSQYWTSSSPIESAKPFCAWRSEPVITALCVCASHRPIVDSPAIENAGLELSTCNSVARDALVARKSRFPF
jgi:hypothetical protein